MGTCDESIYLGFDFSTQQVNVRSAVWCSKRNLLNMWQTVVDVDSTTHNVIGSLVRPSTASGNGIAYNA
jgi:hypothetical protein